MGEIIFTPGTYPQAINLTLFYVTSSVPQGPILADAAGQISNLRIDSDGLYNDSQPTRNWGVTGTLTTKAWAAQNIASFGYVSGGNQTLSNYLTGTDAALRVSGNFMATFIAKASGSVRPSNNVLYYEVGGGYININTGFNQWQPAGASQLTTPVGQTPQDVPFVITIGRSGTTNYMKINQNATVSGSAGAPVSGTEYRLGGSNSANSWKGIIYGFWMNSSPFTEAAVSGNHTTAMQFLGI